MPDVNLLPEDLRDDEDERKKNRSLSIPMSTPLVEEEHARRVVGVNTSGQTADAEDPKLKRVREESYIRVNSQGKMIHETPVEESIRRPLPWWRRLFAGRVQAVRVAAPTPPVSVPSVSGYHEKSPTVVSVPVVTTRTVTPIRESNVAQKVPPPSSPKLPPVSRITPLPTESKGRSLGRNEPVRSVDPLAPPSLGVNLLPTDWTIAPQLSATFRLKIIVVCGVLFVATVVGSVLGRWAYVQNQESLRQALTQERQTIETEIATYQESEQAWTVLRNRLVVLDDLLTAHVNVLPAFAVLEETVIPEVTYTRASVAADGKIGVSGKTRTRELLAKQVLALGEGAVKPKQVDIVSFSVDPKTSEVNFDLSIVLPPQTLTYVTP